MRFRGSFIRSSSGPFDISVERAKCEAVSDKRNSYLIQELIESWTARVADTPLGAESKPKRVYADFQRQLLSRKINDTIVHYASLAQELMFSMTLYGAGSSTGAFVEELKDTPVFYEYIRFRKTGDPKLLSYILSVLLYGKKTDYVDDELHATAFRRWLGVEEKLKDLQLPDLTDLAVVVAALIDVDAPDMPYMARHGPGSVADGWAGSIEKTNHLSFDSRIHRAFYTDNCFKRKYQNCDWGVEVLPDPDSWERRSVYSPIPKSAELVFVSKTTKTARSISMETAVRQYHQQLYRWSLENRLNVGIIRNYVTLHDQTRNQRFAEYGSITGDIDTLDLSDASDSVSWDLVKKIFPREILYFLQATRSTEVKLPDGTIMPVNKFAPMGSALCFPVQSIIYSAVVLYSYMVYAQQKGIEIDFDINGVKSFTRHHIKRDLGLGHFSKLEPFSVYGDDIICDSRVTKDVVRNLVLLGFTVNTDKSFTASQAIRESCGKYYWNGHDVTPLLFRVKTWEKKRNVRSLASLIDACNNAGDQGCVNLRRYLMRSCLYKEIEGVKSREVNPVRFSDDRNASNSIFTHRGVNTRNRHLRRRENMELFRSEVRGLLIRSVQINASSRTKVDKLSTGLLVTFEQLLDDDSFETFERYRYNQQQIAAFASTDSGSDLLEPVPATDSRGARLVWGWTPDQ